MYIFYRYCLTMASTLGSCKHHPYDFCYVCGVFMNKLLKHTISEGNRFCLAYDAYFGFKVGDQDKRGATRSLWKLSVYSGVVVQRRKAKKEVWLTKNMEGTNKLPKKLLLLYGYSDRSP